MARPIKPREIEIPIGPSIAYVPLTRGLYALIDAEDAEKVGRYAWHAAPGRASFYGRRKSGERHAFLHELILGEREGCTVDHANCTRTLDNRKCNLRHATRSQQVWNRRSAGSSSGFRGVFFEPEKALYRVVIGANGKQMRLGRYKSKEDAARVYDAAARSLHGEFAVLNFPEAA